MQVLIIAGCLIAILASVWFIFKKPPPPKYLYPPIKPSFYCAHRYLIIKAKLGAKGERLETWTECIDCRERLHTFKNVNTSWKPEED